jgi:hypothetical protein
MFDNTNPYTLRTEIVEGITHYYVSFSDGQAIPREPRYHGLSIWSFAVS